MNKKKVLSLIHILADGGIYAGRMEDSAAPEIFRIEIGGSQGAGGGVLPVVGNYAFAAVTDLFEHQTGGVLAVYADP